MIRRVLPVAAILLHAIVAHAEESTPPKKSLRRKPEPIEVEVVDLTGDRDPQAFALGAHIGGGYMTNIHSGGQGAPHVSLVADFGLGENGARKWTLEPFAGFAISIGSLREVGGHPNRFTEIGARLVYRGDSGLLDHRWIGFGAGLVWSSRRPSSGFTDPPQPCFKGEDAATAAGADCSRKSGISPGLLVDLGVGLHEWVVRRARWGFALRMPLQISSSPGFSVFAVFYGQIGTAL
jgi:hypothetical protein